MTKETITTGRAGEVLAAQFLKGKGYKILDKNYRKRFGEIDIVARDGNFLVFVEVKTRKSKLFGEPYEAVDFRKQKQLIKIAQDYINTKGYHDQPARFDIVSILLNKKESPKVELIKNGFSLE